MVYYNGAHSMTFLKKRYDYYPIDDVLCNYKYYHDELGLIKNSWEDWNLIPCNGEYISPPIMKKQIIDLPGANGSIDISTIITGYPLYSNRTGSFEFYFVNKDILENDKGFTWPEILSEISRFFNSNQIMLILEDDKFFYYEGSFWIDSFKSDKIMSKIVINYNVNPYKMPIVSTYDQHGWLWDPFDFNNGFIQSTFDWTRSIIHNGDKVNIICGDEPQIIRLETTFRTGITSDVKIKCSNENIEYIIGSGTGYALLTDVSKNVNVEKTLTFSFDGDEDANFRLEIEYIGGYL